MLYNQDEIYLLFRYSYTAEFIEKLWKRIRKYGGFATGITQNIQEVLASSTASIMLSNSELLIMLNQSAIDGDLLAENLKLSDMEKSYIKYYLKCQHYYFLIFLLQICT